MGTAWSTGLVSMILLLMGGAASAQTGGKQVSYFFGESRMASPTGIPYGSSISMIERTVDSAAGTIVERVVSIDANKPATEYVTVLDVKGTTFTMAAKDGSFTGTGELAGTPWHWTSWQSTATIAGGQGKVVSQDTLTEEGLHVAKTFFSPDGQARVVFSEDLRSISKAMFTILRGKLLASAE
jgi:hypothetical protein